MDLYADKFEELSRYYPAYQHATSDHSKCVKFKNGLRPELKQGIAILEMNDYGHLVQKTKDYEEAYKERVSASKNSKAKRDASHDKGKDTLAPKGRDFKQSGYHESNNSSGKTYGKSSGSFKQIRCGKCGKDHYSHQCKEKDIICFRCNKPGHMSRDCLDVKPESQTNRMETSGRVFSLIRNDVVSENPTQDT